MTTPTREPQTIYAGDSVTWQKSLADYPASAGWSLRYDLGGPETIQVASSAAGDVHLIEIAAATTAEWGTGTYGWAARAINGSQRITVATGTLEVKADPDAGSDQRPHCKVMLDAIESLLEGKATKDQQEYKYKDMSLVRMPFDDLLRVRRLYFDQWQAYQRKQSGKTSRLIKTRF